MRYLCAILFLLGTGVTGFSHGDMHGQIQEVTKLLDKDPRNAALYLKRGELYLGRWRL